MYPPRRWPERQWGCRFSVDRRFWFGRLVWPLHDGNRRGAGRESLSSAGFRVAVLVLPARGRRQLSAVGRPIVTTTHGGYTLLLANNPYFYQHLRREPWGSVWDAREGRVPSMRPDTATPPSLSGRELSEIESDRSLYDLRSRRFARSRACFCASPCVAGGICGLSSRWETECHGNRGLVVPHAG